MSEPQEKISKAIEVKAEERPVYCPIPEHQLWNQHPRVFIQLEENHKEAACPYCSTKFKLID